MIELRNQDRLTEVLRVQDILKNLEANKFTVAQIETILSPVTYGDLDAMMRRLESIAKSTPVLKMLVYG